MANQTPNFGNKQELQDYINSLKEIDFQYQSLNRQAKELASVPGSAKNEVLKQLKALREQYDTHKEILTSIKQAESELKNFTKQSEKATKSLEAQSKAIDDLSDNFSELNTFQRSITRQYGEQSDETRRINKNVDAIKASVGGIGKFLAKNTDLEGDQRDALMEASDYVKSMPSSFDKLNKQIGKGTISQKKYNQYVSELSENWEEILDKIDSSDSRLSGMKKALKGLGASIGLDSDIGRKLNEQEIAKAQRNTEMGALFSGLPGGDGLSEYLQAKQLEKANPTSSGAKLKRTAAGAALGAGISQLAIGMREYIPIMKDAYYFFADIFAPLIAKAEGEVAVQQAIFNRNFKLGKQLGSQYANQMFYAAEASKNFGFEMQNLGAEFNAASKTAFFGHGIGSIGYGADAMQLAGIGAEQVAAALTDIASGANVNFFGTTLGAQAAVFSKEMGISTQSVAEIMAAFRRMDGSSGKTALNLTYSAAKLADMKGLNPAVILQDMADASEKLLSYNIQNKDAFLQQAIAIRQMGGSLPKFAQGITSSILNFPEAMKAQISLSNILNRSVDFSVAQSLAYQGKYAEAFENIKQSGVLESVRKAGPIASDMFSKIFGLSIDEFQARAEGGKSVGLSDSLNAENKSFLDRVVGAQGGLRITQARIQADKAILDAKFAQTLAEELQKDKAYRDAFKTADSLNAAASTLQAVVTGLITGVGAFFGARLLGGKGFLGGSTSTTGAGIGGLSPTSTIKGGGNPFGFVDKNGNPLTMQQSNMKLTKGGTIPISEGLATQQAKMGGALNGTSKSLKYIKVGGKILGIAGVGLDAYSRIQEGQSAGQMIAGVGTGVAGSYAGAQLGAAAGAFGGPLAPITVPVGALIGGIGGYFLGSKAADYATGADEVQSSTPKLSGGGDVLTTLRNIEMLVASMAGTGDKGIQLMLDGKDISNSLIRNVQFGKGNNLKSTLKQVLGN
jgi:hypothetical protein